MLGYSDYVENFSNVSHHGSWWSDSNIRTPFVAATFANVRIKRTTSK
jgi:hypothetical protein